jgi:hypothetical protein
MADKWWGLIKGVIKGDLNGYGILGIESWWGGGHHGSMEVKYVV